MSEQKISQEAAEAMNNGQQVVVSFADVQTLGEFKNVAVKVPGMLSPGIKKIDQHVFARATEGSSEAELVEVPAHQRDRIWIDGRTVTRNFYGAEDYNGKTVRARVAIRHKTAEDENEETQEYLVIDVYAIDDKFREAESELKIGCDDAGDVGFLIPMTKKFVCIKPAKQRPVPTDGITSESATA